MPLAHSGIPPRRTSSVAACPPIVAMAPLLPACDVEHHVLGLHWDNPRVRVGVWEDVDGVGCREERASGSDRNAPQVTIKPIIICSLGVEIHWPAVSRRGIAKTEVIADVEGAHPMQRDRRLWHSLLQRRRLWSWSVCRLRRWGRLLGHRARQLNARCFGCFGDRLRWSFACHVASRLGCSSRCGERPALSHGREVSVTDVRRLDRTDHAFRLVELVELEWLVHHCCC